jgi:hypothetical protein
VTTALQTDPATALQWASSIGSDSMRTNQISRVVNTWARTDPTAATAAVQNANLTDQQRAILLNNIQRINPPNSN